jgi:hypothetical protein
VAGDLLRIQREGHVVSCMTPGLHKNQGSNKVGLGEEGERNEIIGCGYISKKLTIRNMVSR